MARSRAFAVVATALALSGCAGRVEGVFVPSPRAAGTNLVDMLVATTRQKDAKPGEMFSGERGAKITFANIVVSIPPDGARKVGEVQWPERLPANPEKDFAVFKAVDIDRNGAGAWFNHTIARVPKRRVMVFVHGFNNRFDDAVYRFAQIVHDSHAPVAPILFTWPSRGSVLAYGYDRESTNYSRDALEQLLQVLAKSPNVGEVSILAHSMGNWLVLEALRQMGIRNGRVSPKIKSVMLAAPDVDVDVFRRQIAEMGKPRPSFSLFVSQDDRALALSRRVWGGGVRLGAIDPEMEPYRNELAQADIQVFDMTKLAGGDRLNHGKFAESPEVVRLIGQRLAEGQTITDSRVGLGDRIVQLTAGAAATVGSAAGLVLSAPVAVLDANSRNNYGAHVENFGRTLTDTTKSAVELAPE